MAPLPTFGLISSPHSDDVVCVGRRYSCSKLRFPSEAFSSGQQTVTELGDNINRMLFFVLKSCAHLLPNHRIKVFKYDHHLFHGAKDVVPVRVLVLLLSTLEPPFFLNIRVNRVEKEGVTQTFTSSTRLQSTQAPFTQKTPREQQPSGRKSNYSTKSCPRFHGK